MSASNIVTEAVNNKVLPSDKSGLPWELWQLILSWLSASDLCRVSCVCKTWTELVASVDSTRWKELYLGCSEWRHPFWPLNIQTEPPSWQLAYRDQYTSTRFWSHRRKRETKNVTCTSLFKKSTFQRSIHVGPGLPQESLKAALSIASDYDRIVMHPGIYDEQLEVLIKVPLELVGYGELGSVILNMGIKQLSTSTRLTGLVLRAPWFTSFIINVNSGYLQIDNCILEDGVVCCRNPCTVFIKFCSFRHSSVILQHMNVGIIENCEFSQSGGANIFIEGHPKEERSWAYSFLKERMNAVYQQRRSRHRKKLELKESSSVTSTIQSSFTAKSQSGPLSDVVFQEAGLNFEALEESPWKYNVPGPNYFHPKEDNMIGCGDIHSVYEDCILFEQAGVASSLLTDGTRNTTKQSKTQSACLESSTNNSQFSDKVSVFNSGANNSEEIFIQDNYKIMELSESITENEHKASTDVSSLQRVYEKQCTHSAEEKQSCKIYNFEKNNSLTSGFISFETLSHSNITDHLSLKKAVHRKSIDSHISFHLNENISDSQPVQGNVSKGDDEHIIGISHITDSSTLSADAAYSRLPPIPKLSPAKISYKGEQPAGSPEIRNKKSNQSISVNIKHSKNIEIAEKNTNETVNVLKDTNLRHLSQKQILNRPRDTKTSDKVKTCSIEIDMSLTDQISGNQNYLDRPTENLSTSLNSDSREFDNDSDYHHKKLVLDSLATSDQISRDVFPNQFPDGCCNSQSEIACGNNSITKESFGPACCKNDDPNQLVSGQKELQVDDNITDFKSPSLEHWDNFGNNVLLGQPEGGQPPLRRSQSDEVLMESGDDLSILDEIEQSDDSSGPESE
ncbi:unnamed protein product [Candidula unifasciata]|uniref:F-box domain-containing protein n=1 Tax=Candidula unifasciata TaxID=100452 RepID=A0A8S3YWS1_9EUPU|nr:unnamed protein product [Candidula unifasciata]